LLEYDNHRGFRCQRCSEWTLGGNLYSSRDGKRICFLCHIEEVSREMARRFSDLEKNDLKPTLSDTGIDDTLLFNEIRESTDRYPNSEKLIRNSRDR
jgi:hypothetical protein